MLRPQRQYFKVQNCRSDNGIGMSAAFIDKLKELFEQETLAMPIYEGSGLGMTIVKSLVKMIAQIEVWKQKAG